MQPSLIETACIKYLLTTAIKYYHTYALVKRKRENNFYFFIFIIFLSLCAISLYSPLTAPQHGVVIVLQWTEEGWMHLYLGANDCDAVSRTYLQLLYCSAMLMTHFCLYTS